MAFVIHNRKFCDLCGLDCTGLVNCPRCHTTYFKKKDVLHIVGSSYKIKNTIKRTDFQLDLFFDNTRVKTCNL